MLTANTFEGSIKVVPLLSGEFCRGSGRTTIIDRTVRFGFPYVEPAVFASTEEEEVGRATMFADELRTYLMMY